MLKRLKCPNCYSQARQTKADDGLVTCGKCSSTYFEDSDVTIKTEEGNMFSDISDNDEPASFFSDNYEPSANEEESDIEDFLKNSPKNLFDDNYEPSAHEEGSDLEDFLKNSTKNMFDDVSDQEEPTVQKAQVKVTRSNMFDDIDSSDDDEEEPVKKKGKSIKRTKEQKNKKLPAIFSDKLMPSIHKPTAQRDEVFSDMDDDDAFSETKNAKSRKRRYSESSEDFSDSEAPLQVFDPKRNGDEVKSRSVKKIERPSLKFNPYIVFNKLTRKKLAQENPYMTNVELSKLVSKAWRSMEETQKEKFIQEQKELRDDMLEMNRKLLGKKRRPTGNGYILYSAEELKKVQLEYPDIKAINDLSSIVGIRWKGLSEEEKDVYRNKAKKEKEEWIRDNPEEHQLYLDKMIKKIKKTKASKYKKK